MITLYLARHGETEENKAQILQGHIPGHLSHEGIRQAEVLRDKLQDMTFDAVVCSDLQRAVDTAMIVALPHRLQPISTSLLRERDWGAFTGKPISSIQGKEFPEDTESVAALFERARRFIAYLRGYHEGKVVLAVGHGLFNRTIIACLHGKTIRDIPRIANAEVRVELIDGYADTTPDQQQETEADN